MVMKESEEKLERDDPVPDFELRGTDDETYTLADFADYDALHPDDEATEVYVDDAIDAVLAGEDVDLEFMPSRGCSIKWK